MKTTLYSILAAAACGMAFGQTAYTNPVGFVSLGDTTVGQPAIKANTDVHVSIPLLRSSDFAGTVASVVGSTITITNAAFALNQWVAANPSVIVVESGTCNGMIMPIIANNATSVTIAPGSFDISSLAATHLITIRKAWTVSSFMSGASSLNGLVIYAYSGNSTGINASSDIQYFYNGATWEDGDGAPADNTVLYPGEGFIIRTSATPVSSFTLSGDVPKAKSYVQVGTRAGGPRDTLFSYISPADEPLGDSGAGFAAGDILYAFNNAASGKNKSGVPYFYTGAAWEDGDGAPAAAFPLAGGRAYLYRRASTTVTGQQNWQNTQSYNPLQ